MIPVRMPSGISAIVAVLATSSINSRYAPPIARQAGRSTLWSGPTSIRPKWGMISPIHPITPLTHTAAEVTNVQQTTIVILSASVLTP